MSTTEYLILYCAVVVAASLAGGYVAILVRLTHRGMQLAGSLVAGFMLGVAVLILLPHALAAISITATSRWILVGLMVMFFLERFFFYHHHDVPSNETHAPHAHSHSNSHHETPMPAGAASWAGVGLGLALHSVIDGVVLAAAVFAQPASSPTFMWPGLAVFLVVALHRPMDSMTLLALTKRGPGSRKHWINLIFAMAVPVGAAMFALGVTSADVEHQKVAGCGMAFAAGVFLCVALSDLLPEIQFHRHDRVGLSAALLLGLALAWTVHHFESQVDDTGPSESANHQSLTPNPQSLIPNLILMDHGPSRLPPTRPSRPGGSDGPDRT